MTKQLLSEEWIKEYAELWNETPATRDGTSDLTVSVVYRLAEDPDNRKAQINIKEGEVVYAGSTVDDKPDFVLTAKTDIWRQFGDGKLRAQKAITLKKLKFDGPLMVALSHITALEAALRLFGSVTETEWN